MIVTYRMNDNIYINLTNRCSNNCGFCVRNEGSFEGYDLWLEKEPEVEQVIAELGDMEGAKEIVFCGFGEPLYRLDAIIPIAEYAHSKGKKTRLNTNGQARHIAGSGVAKRLAGKIDTISISLNATSSKAYQEICQSEFGEDAFFDLLDFAKECKEYIPNVVLSVVDIVGEEEIKKAGDIAASLGVKLRVRKLV